MSQEAYDESLAKPPLFPTLVKRFWKVCILVVVLADIAAIFAYSYYRDLAEKQDIALVGEMPERSLVFDRHGQVLGRLHGVNRMVVPLKGISPYFLDALLAREDSRFFEHDGVDYFGAARAVVRNLKDGTFTQGASTLTMQLSRVSYDIRQKTLHRKLLEVMLARRIEAAYSKEDILAFYINRIYFGTGLYGVERASQAYFGKHASELDLSEAAMLVGIIRAPNRFSPFRHYEKALRERNMVLDRMVQCGFITEREKIYARGQKVAVLSADRAHSFQNSYALDMVRRDLNLILEKQDLEDGGLLVYTSLDMQLQQTTEDSLEERLNEVESLAGFRHQKRADYLWAKKQKKELPVSYLQGAVVVIDNETGGIRAITGGRDFSESQYNRATQSNRQIGSLYKPFVYAAAYKNGLLPGTLVDDGPIKRGEIKWTPGHYWSPKNSDGSYRGLQTAEYGLIKSRNTMTVRVGEKAGIDNVVKMAHQVGLKTPQKASPQIYIGNLGADVKSITSAFSAFPNDGFRMRPFIIDAIQDQRGNIIYQNEKAGYRMLSKGAAWLTNQTLQKVVATGGTAARARSMGLEGPAAGKTGTTDAYKDAWFVGYTDKLTCGVWVGLDQPKTIMDRGYGSTLAVPIWTKIMLHATKNGYPAQPFESDVTLVNVDVCQVSGGLANWSCNNGGHGYQVAIPVDLVPKSGCREHGWHLAKRQEPQQTRPQQPQRGIFGWFRQRR